VEHRSIKGALLPHLVLLGDSIFDNAVYVPGHPAVIEQVRTALPRDWRATLLAVDGNIAIDVVRHLEKLPADATHLAISTGGNNALIASGILGQPAHSVSAVLHEMADIQADFRREYREMLSAVRAHRLPTLVCTIYDAIPGLDRDAVAALTLFNDVILREAIAAGIPVLDLRLLCNENSDYSPLSPIEPSHLGGRKIAEALVRIVTSHDFSRGETVIYSQA
jgi:GDSL-like Lipase/Acylhydrolase family